MSLIKRISPGEVHELIHHRRDTGQEFSDLCGIPGYPTSTNHVVIQEIFGVNADILQSNLATVTNN